TKGNIQALISKWTSHSDYIGNKQHNIAKRSHGYRNCYQTRLALNWGS
ncbi:uncharacterized protein METZ01_LOCUS159856, partial [marine metagenome]